MMRWIGVGLLVSAVLAIVITQHAVKSDAEERRVALAQASYTQGKCTITNAEVIEWRHDTKDETIRGSTIEATFVVHAPTGDVPGATYRYSDSFWTPQSAKNAVATTHAKGASIACFFDAAKPSNAVLVRRGMPAEDTMNPWIPGGLVAGLLAGFGLLLLLVKPGRSSTR